MWYVGCGLCVAGCVLWVVGCTLPEVSIGTAGAQQLDQVKRMIGGSENMLFSIYSQTQNV